MIIDSVVGPAQVLHRLALGVEVIDARTARLTGLGLRAGRQVAAAPTDQGWPCVDLEYSGPGRFRLRQVPGLPGRIVVRLDDPTRRFVPRRFEVALWPVRNLERSDETPPSGAFIPVASRLLRPWLLPGSACALPGGTTAVRGRVVRGGGAQARWPRIRAFGAGGALVGWAHGDERGEFLLVVRNPGLVPPPVDDAFDIDLEILAPPSAQVPEPSVADRCADLVIEQVPRSAVPPAPGDLNNSLLRGQAQPPGYVTSATGRVRLTVNAGQLLTVPNDLRFTG